MEKIDLAVLKTRLNADLDAQFISGRNLLDRFRVIDEDSRKTAPYLDHRYAPFFYHLGKYCSPQSVVEIGFTLGLLSGSFFTSCKSVTNFLGFKEESKEFYSMRLGRANIRLVYKGPSNFYVGRLHDKKFDDIFSPNSWDLTILNDETVFDKHLEYLDFVWPKVSENGLVVAEYIARHIPARDAFLAFCKSKNRSPVIFETRYGTGIVQK